MGPIRLFMNVQVMKPENKKERYGPLVRPIMFVGTCSDAGKSVINTAFCRIFRQDGYHPAPFKAQNMSLNSFSTPEGGEIGRAQAVQAEACGLSPHTDMNPLLLKPTHEKSAQVILNGRPVGNMRAKEFFLSDKRELFEEAVGAFKRLAARYNPVVLEGAGSISELNLRERDITNMRMAREVGAATYLVADIDRGGVFASVYGSIALLEPAERKLMRGILVNKFRGDIALFEEGRRILEELTGIPVVGVIPYFRDIHIEEEDSVALESKACRAVDGKINVAVILLRRLSNFTDFDVLERDGRFHVYYTDDPEEIRKADIVILPGSKNTIADMNYIRSKGIAEAILEARKAGKKIVGICGGYQMMGMRIEDPEGVEGPIQAVPGLGLLPQVTSLTSEKVTRQRKFRFQQGGDWCTGYEIHMGKTRLTEGTTESPLNELENGGKDGYRLDAHCWGTYMHGILDNAVVLDELAAGLSERETVGFDYAVFKERQYDLLAERVRAAVDMEYIYASLTSGG